MLKNLYEVFCQGETSREENTLVMAGGLTRIISFDMGGLDSYFLHVVLIRPLTTRLRKDRARIKDLSVMRGQVECGEEKLQRNVNLVDCYPSVAPDAVSFQ